MLTVFFTIHSKGFQKKFQQKLKFPSVVFELTITGFVIIYPTYLSLFYQGDQGMVHASEERNSLTKVLHFAEYHKGNAARSQASFLFTL